MQSSKTIRKEKNNRPTIYKKNLNKFESLKLEKKNKEGIVYVSYILMNVKNSKTLSKKGKKEEKENNNYESQFKA